VSETVTGDEEPCTGGEDPKVDKVEDGGVVAKVEHEVMPCTLLVLVRTHREEVKRLKSIRDVHPSIVVRG
jgi:hypothetical protein